MNLNIKIQDQDFVLHPFGAAYWPEQEVLLVADVHLGKVSHFRKHGSAVPLKAAAQNFIRLDELRKEFDPEHIVFMGDLFHSSLNIEWNMFEEWVSSIDNRVHLVAGNHDIISPTKYESLGIEIYSEIKVAGFHLSHHPEPQEDHYNICGHIHPGFKMRGDGRQLLKLSCFFRSSNQLILPAFGEFTGNYFIEPEEGDRIFAITGKEVIQVN
ncbi:ligase-associated DNA damage response endonuclease PdeM [Christiangramia sabulilitoris]|uniref:Ligase-associated DNA damage response endonuclease PdeM n=1 Tax=Christiangramia sabulilitoris TaxID=2583991 RepID=A0A550I8D7_9FLAO|nr:ligase-associated DNA damage response endonuclease PdeM [Christiangramia sabulilitoris]TRO67245.1 ligase-associated DNA damage response endonuclease PdeM [Christiangramia sabulilitoris]